MTLFAIAAKFYDALLPNNFQSGVEKILRKKIMDFREINLQLLTF